MAKKISREQVKEIKRLKKTGMPTCKIAIRVGCSDITVRNYTSKKSREKHRKYQRERYHNDEEFRKKVTAGNIKTQKRYRLEGRLWKDMHPIKFKKWQQAYNKKYEAEHKGERAEYAKNYRINHREELRLKAKEYCNSPEGKKAHKKYFKKHKDKIKLNNKKWCLKNKDKLTEYQKTYCRKNRNKINKYGKQYYIKNRDKILKRRKESYKKNK